MDSIFGLSPVVAMDQKTISYNPRSTIGTVTEIYDYLRLLFAKLGVPLCPVHQEPLKKTSLEDIYKKVFQNRSGQLVTILAPVIRGKKGFMTAEIQKYIQKGFVKARIDGKMQTLNENIKLGKRKSHHIEIVMDRIYVEKKYSSRMKESLKRAVELSDGFAMVQTGNQCVMYSVHASCPVCLFSSPDLDPKFFSFNSPKGACINCNGVGVLEEDDWGNQQRMSGVSWAKIKAGSFICSD